MALTPTLLKELKQTVGLGLVVLGGLAATSETGQRGPSVGALSVGGQVPTISVQLGPTADADVGYHLMVGQIPFLLRSLNIAPGLPDSTPEENDLTPTLVWQETPLPSVGLAIMGGLAPAVVGDTGQSIAVPVGSAVVAGLVPTVSVPAGQEGATAPDKAEMATIALEPTLLIELIVSPEQAALVFNGLAIEQAFQTGWTDVPEADPPGWVDVPRV